MFEIKHFLAKPFEQSWSKQFRSKILERIQLISDKEIKELEKNTVCTILELIKPMFEQGEVNLEIFELDIIQKFIKSPYMEKRLKGLNDLKALIDLFNNKDQAKRKYKLMNSEFLAKWILENQILESIMHNAHEEMVKRSSPIFSFLTTHCLFNESHAILLWNHSKDHHDSIQSAVYSIILEITKYLDRNTQKVLFDKFLTIEIEEFDEKLIETFTEFNKRADWLSERALELLYRIIIEVKDTQSELACQSLVQILIVSNDQQLNKKYLEKAVENIKADKHADQSFILVMKILKMQIPGALKHELYNKLKFLSNGVVELLLDSFDGLANTEKSGLKTKSIKTRLKFWKFLMTESAFEVRIGELNKVKKAFCDLKHPKSSKKFWNTFLKLIQQKFSIEFNALIFGEMFLLNDPTEIIDEHSFEIFNSLFLRVNYYSRNIELKHEKFHSRLQVNLVGYDYLVKCIFKIAISDVQHKAMRLLTGLNLKFSRGLLSKSEEIWGNYFEKLQQYLEGGADEVQKSLKLVTRFLQGFVMKEKGQENCTVMFRSAGESDFNKMTVNSMDCVSVIRKKVADFYKKNPINICLVTHQGDRLDYLYDDFSLNTWKPPFVFTIDYTQLPSFLTPSQFFTKCQKFQQNLLATLPNLQKQNADLAWSLLKRVPLTEKNVSQFLNFEVNFTKILKTDSIYQLVYSLKIIESLIRKTQWLQEFKKVGGIDQMLSIFLENSLDTNCSLILEYNTLIISILSVVSILIEDFSSEFISKILHSLIVSARLCNESEDSGYIAKNAKEVLGYCRQKAGNIFLSTLKSFPIQELLQATLVSCSCSYFSTTMSSFFLELSQSAAELNSFFLNNILDLSVEALKCHKIDSYWTLLCFYIHDCELTEDLKSRYLAFIGYLRDYPAENRANEPDLVLAGLLKVVKTVVQKLNLQPREELVHLVVHCCLFEIPSAKNKSAPKCKHLATRREAFELLEFFCKTESALEFIFEYLKIQYSDPGWRSCKYADWNYHPRAQEKSETGFVGMKNLGCICYMISSLQQLFYISQFRETLFRMERGDEPLEENLLYQLQSLFSGLKNSDKQHVNPKGICKTFKDWEGNPVKLNEQMDADEFINTFMDRLESKISKFPGGNIIKSLFTGQLATELIGQSGCTHRSEVSEAFITLPIQVKNQKSLNESLEAFKQGELLQGNNAYQCDHCDSKVTAIRRVCIKYLPNVLLVTLRRFEFNYDTMKRVKLNDYIEFPNELNMEEYTQEGIEKAELAKQQELEGVESGIERKYPKEYYEYKLRGIIIHMGTAENGHYYSFIKENEQWYEFNDTVVRKIDPKDIPNEAFGGEEKFSFHSNPAFKYKNRNAYILLYERGQYFELNKEEEKLTPWNCTLNNNEIEFNEVKEENERYWRCRSSFSPEYFDFVICLLDKNEEKTLKFVFSFFLTVLVRSRDYTRIFQCLKRMKELLKGNQGFCEWVLEMATVKFVLKELLMDCPVIQKRRLVVGLLIAVYRQVDEPVQETFFLRLLQHLDLARKPVSHNFCQYFELIFRVTQLSPGFNKKFNLTSRLMSYLKTIPQIPESLPDFKNKDIFLGYENYAPENKAELSIGAGGSSLVFLLKSLSKTDLKSEDNEFLFTEENLNMLSSEAGSRYTGQTIGKFLSELCRDNKNYTVKYGAFLIDGIDQVNHDKHKSYMRQLFELMSLQDSLTAERSDSLLFKYFKQIQNNKKYPLATESSIDFLLKVSAKIPAVRDALFRRKSEVKLLESSLPDPVKRPAPVSKEPFIVKNPFLRLENLRKLIKGQFNQIQLEDSDGEIFNADIQKSKSLEYFEVQAQRWIPCQVVCHSEEIVCVKNEGVNQWVDTLSDYLRVVNR